MPDQSHRPDSSSNRPSRGLGKTLLLCAFGLANAGLLASLLTGGASAEPSGFDWSSIDLASVAHAQQGQAADADEILAAQQGGRPSEYLLIPATLTNIGQDIVYVLDTQTGLLSAAAYDNNEGLRFIQPVPVFDR